MLKLIDIKKNYLAGENEVQALKGINISFREHEFVSILGPSGCGKTTLLNIIGGLDHYTSGDLIINGISTKKYKDRDWDTYRNHTIGFVFQNYNLIPHQTVLSNVELALTLSGVSKDERRKKAIEVLKKVGLGDQLNKKPNQMSGGQMQRVAIARALINNPDILLADEPTGALDTETSVQIMELLKEVAKDKLVIMVTHNPELAESYSTRIIRLLDGKLIDDSMPFLGDSEANKSLNENESATSEASISASNSNKSENTDLPNNTEEEKVATKNKNKKKKTSMSFGTALSLSLNNLMTKKARTLLTCFAGSIGIIGIALILSLSNGIQEYINSVEEETLSSYPITIAKEVVDLSGIMETMMGLDEDPNNDPDKIYSRNVVSQALQSMVQDSTTNDLTAFKDWLDSSEEIADCTNAVQYTYDVTPIIYSADTSSLLQVNPFDASASGVSVSNSTMSAMYSSYMNNSWVEMIDNEELVNSQFELLAGKWPEGANECVLVVDQYNQIYDLTLYGLGLRDTKDLYEMFFNAVTNLGDEDTAENIDSEDTVYSFDDLIGLSYKLVLPTDYYQYDEATGAYVDMSSDDEYMTQVINDAYQINLVGIIKIKDDAVSTTISAGSIAYTSALTEYYVNAIQDSELVKAQLADEDTDVLTGLPFETGEEEEYSDEENAELFTEYAEGLDSIEKAELFLKVYSTPDDSEIAAMVDEYALEYPDRDSKINFIADSMIQAIAAVRDGSMDKDTLAASGMDSDTLDYILSLSDDDISAMIQQTYASLSDEELEAAFIQGLTDSITSMYSSQLSESFNSYSNDELAVMFDNYIVGKSDEELAVFYDKYMPSRVSESTYDDNMSTFGLCYLEEPATINLYAKSFDDKEKLKDLITQYNESVDEDSQITYTDYVGLMMSSVTKIINIISYVLIAFVSISLVVSSIMIGIITYISVLERTKEIGILRSIGASKRDISRVFNAESLTIGFISGALGILITVLLNIPINIIIKKLTDVTSLSQLPVMGGIILILISMFLTFIAGLIPSRLAAKKDPVLALRSE
jgi:putative ABC transport system permease protein